MTEISATEKYLKEKGIQPKIYFAPGEEHIVTMTGKDKLEDITTRTGEVKQGVKYLVMEDGIAKVIITAADSLISKLVGALKEKATVKITQKKYSNSDGEARTTYDVSKVDSKNQGSAPDVDAEEDDIPIIDDEEPIDIN